MAGASLSSLRRLEAGGRGTIQLMVALAQAMQATQALDELFAAPAQTIAQIEAAQRIMARKRARKPALAMDRAGG